MKYRDNKVTDIQIAYIGGGSRGWAWTFMTDLALEEQISGTIRLYDIDETAAGNNEVIGNRLMQREDARGDWRFETRTSLQDALTGCDFVVISILPGTFDEMESDVHLPERLGIYQPVGDTAGPGGMIRALRTIPMFVEIAEAVKAYAPGAWVINYTNPMSLCVKTLYLCGPVQAVVETNAVFERDAIRPILAGDLPECVKELIMPAVENHEAILEAALTCNEGLVVKAFMNAPQVKGRKR